MESLVGCGWDRPHLGALDDSGMCWLQKLSALDHSCASTEAATELEGRGTTAGVAPGTWHMERHGGLSGADCPAANTSFCTKVVHRGLPVSWRGGVGGVSHLR